MEEYYAQMSQLITKNGVNVQKGDIVYIECPIEVYQFVRYIQKQAFLLGASNVVISYEDQQLSNYRIQYESTQDLSAVQDWLVQKQQTYNTINSVNITIRTECGVQPIQCQKERMLFFARYRSQVEYYNRINTNKLRWCLVICPTLHWAENVFPEDANPLNTLLLQMNNILFLNDFNRKWNEINGELHRRRDALNKLNLQKLHFTSVQTQTDLTIELSNPIWIAGPELCEGILFNPNIPSFEVFTGPNKYGVNGFVRNTKPLKFNNQLINQFWFQFKNGQVVDFDSDNKELLNEILQKDAGSKYLGEVALVSQSSPISASNVTFLTTLFDENAASHLALGCGYAPAYSDSQQMNVSQQHVDFMFGCADMRCVGFDSQGEEVELMVSGEVVV